MRGRGRTRLPRTVPPGQLRRTLEAIRRLRTSFVFGTVLVLFLVLLGRLAKLQLFEGDHYRELARKRHVGRYELQAQRGLILDRFGRVLAQSRPLRRVAVDPHPQVVRDPETFSLLVSRLLDEQVSASEVRAIVEKHQAAHERTGKCKRYVVLRPRIEDPLIIDRLDTVSALSDHQKRKRKVWGLIVERGEVREYPNDRHAYHVLGKVPREDASPRVGIEGHFHRHLSGTNHKVRVLRDGRRRVMAMDESLAGDAYKGGDVRITIDVVVQHALEEALDEVVREWQPPQLCGIVMDPHTGEVLAWANRPNRNGNLDGNAASRYAGEHDFVGAWTYEVGSVFKPITVAWALEQGVVTPGDEIDMPLSRLFPGCRKTISDTHFVGRGDLRLLLQESSNTGAAELARRLGSKGMMAMWSHLGLGERPEIEFPNINAGRVNSEARRLKRWPAWLYHRFAYGQGNTLSPLQLACLYCGIARDDARVVKPSILYRRKLRDPRGPRLCDPKYLPVIRDGLRRVVTQGTAKRVVAQSKYPIAGKTGTAIVGTFNICGFAGYAPAHDPQMVCIVLARVPRAQKGSGAKVAGPAVRDVLDATLTYIACPEDPRAVIGGSPAPRSAPAAPAPNADPSRGLLLAPPAGGERSR